jgi:hypothetical protein
MASPSFNAEMDRKRGTTPRTKIEFIDKDDNVTDVTDHYDSGANFEQVRERAPDEIQAGQLDIVFINHDNMFSEYDPTSLLYNLDYHGAKIRVSEGFLLPDGTLEYEVQGVVFIDQLVTDPLVSRITFRCRDQMWRIMDQKLHARPDSEIPVPDAGNVGDGVVTGMAKLPFTTINQNWTLTCTTPGTDDIGQFSVVGSVSGSIGPAVSGTEFIHLGTGLRFTIRAGPTDWTLLDKFTFSTAQHPEWVEMNAGKIVWSILTGYDWDTNTVEPFAASVFNMDHTKSDANIDLDYEAFSTAITAIDFIDVFNLTGYIPYDSDAVELLQSLIVVFLGSLYTGSDGRIKMSLYIPPFTPSFREFSDADKIMSLTYSRGIDEVINHVVVNYKGSNIWDWSNTTSELDGHFVDRDITSVANRGQLSQVFNIPWYTASGDHVQDFASKLISRFKDPPLNIEFVTGMDALETEIGDRVIVTDIKLALDQVYGEVTRLVKQFDTQPASITVQVRHDATSNALVGALGSEIDEGDGLSPQSDNYDTSSATDKAFAYFSKVGSAAQPQYFAY